MLFLLNLKYACSLMYTILFISSCLLLLIIVISLTYAINCAFLLIIIVPFILTFTKTGDKHIKLSNIGIDYIKVTM